MSTGHAHRLHVPVGSPVHALPAHTKLVALLAFVVLVVATPREQVWAFAVDAALLVLVARSAGLPLPVLVRRLVVELPFVLFAVLLPFVAHGPRVHVAGVRLSVEGLWGAWNVLAKSTLGVGASVLLAATTDPRALLAGLQRLRLPALLVQILSFMLRYADVVAEEMARMKVARESRGFAPRDLRSAGVVAGSAGALFIRSYERGERVHLAMLSRGYDGSMPLLDDRRTPARAWLTALSLPALAALVAVTALVVR